MAGTDGPGDNEDGGSGGRKSEASGSGGRKSEASGGEGGGADGSSAPRESVADSPGTTEHPGAGSGTLRSRFEATVSTWPRRTGVGVGGLVLLVVVLSLAGVVGTPAVALVDEGDWGEVTDERTEIVTTVETRNPNPLGVSFGNSVVVDYDVVMNDVLLAEGRKSNIEIPAGTSRTELRTDVYNDRLPEWWVRFVRNDETVVVNATATLGVDALVSTSHDVPVNRTVLGNRTPVIDALSASVNSTSDTYTKTVGVSEVDDSVLDGSGTGDGALGGGGDASGGDGSLTVGYEIRRGWATWGTVTRNETTVRFHLRIHNPGDVPVPGSPDGLGVVVDTNEIPLFEAGNEELSGESTGTDAVIRPGETQEVTFAVTMDNDNVDEWFTSHVRRTAGPGQEATTVRSQFQVVFAVPATGATFRLPSASPLTYDCEFRTAILVDGRNTSSTCGQPTAPTP